MTKEIISLLEKIVVVLDHLNDIGEHHLTLMGKKLNFSQEAEVKRHISDSRGIIYSELSQMTDLIDSIEAPIFEMKSVQVKEEPRQKRKYTRKAK